jgi:Contractile injection system tube protein
MERIAFLVESTGERIGALLNPESLVVRRRAGVGPRRAAGGQLAGAGLADDPLLYTGGGRTELDLELLFDVDLARPTLDVDDVRELTGPLWQLAENGAEERYGRPALVRFVWGKSWNVRGIVGAVAERLERFTAAGTARRSWLSLRLLRVAEGPVTRASEAPTPPPAAQLDAAAQAPPDVPVAHEVLGAGGEGGVGESLYDLAFAYYGNPGLWRLIAGFNGITDPLRVPPGTVLRIPPAPGAGGP